MPDDIVLDMVSLRGTPERDTLGEEGRVVEVGEDVTEGRRDRPPPVGTRWEGDCR